MSTFNECGLRLFSLRRKLKAAALKQIKLDGGCYKSQEGQITVTGIMPPIVSDDLSMWWKVEVYSYTLCPDGRRGSACGEDLDDVLDQVEEIIDAWIAVSEHGRLQVSA
jgi:hypothetical protein